MKRRNFLLGSLSLPAWLSCAFQRGALDRGEDGILEGTALARAFQRARARGKPLFVILIPEDDERSDRGHLWGEFLTYGGDLIWPLSLCELICANKRELSSFARVSRGALFSVIDTSDTLQPEAKSYKTKLLSLRTIIERDSSEWSALISERINTLGALVNEALLEDGPSLSARANFVEALIPRESKSFRSRLDYGTTTSKDVYDFAALYASLKSPYIPGLVEAANAQIVKPTIEGSRWARSSVCGPVQYEDPTPEEREAEARRKAAGERGMWACGLGFIPEQSRRFLSFYTEETS